MATAILRLIRDAKTGKRSVTIGYESDSDALPNEHEEDHRRLVERIVPGGAERAARGQPSEVAEEKKVESERERAREKA